MSTLISAVISAGNCSLDGSVLHAGQSCLLKLQANYTLTGGSLVIRCLINSTLSFVPPTAVGFTCPISAPLHTTLGNCSSVLSSGASCVLVSAGGFTLASGSLILSCSLGQLSAYPTLVHAISPPLVSLVDPPSTFQLGSGLLVLQASTSSAAASPSLQYTWSYISAVDQAAGLPPTFLPSSSSSQLQLDPSLLLPGTMYNISVRVVDTSQVDNSGTAPSSVTSTTVRVVLATQQVLTVAGVDPCSNFQCLNGGRCVATAIIPGSLNYTLTCACPTSPVQFLGASCGFALLECPNGNALYAEAVDIAIYGIGFSTLRRITVAGRVVQFQTDVALNSSSPDAEWQGVLSRWPTYATSVQRVRFVAPALTTTNRTTTNVTTPAASRLRLLSAEADAAVAVNPPPAYQMLTLSSLLLADGSGSGKLLETNVSNVLYYSSSTCRNEGQWEEDGAGGCLPCPAGAFWSVSSTERAICTAFFCVCSLRYVLVHLSLFRLQSWRRTCMAIAWLLVRAHPFSQEPQQQ
jgi:hypothetical protein